MGRTTIEITDEQKAELDDLKQHEREAYRSVLDCLLDAHDGEGGDVPTEDVITEIRDEIDTLAFDGAISEERAERLEQSLSTVEERTGRIEKTLEDLQR